MPLPATVLDYVDNITVGFKNTNAAQVKGKEPRVENN